MRSSNFASVFLAVAFVSGCAADIAVVLLACFASSSHGASLADWALPPVPVPSDNPQSDAKIDLGRQLLGDTRLSKNDRFSCISCHEPTRASAGSTPRALGLGGELTRRAPSLINSGYYTSLFWDGRAASLEQQTGALEGHPGPITSPVEMGADIHQVARRLNQIPGYKEQFNRVFGTDATPENIAKAIAAFERTLVAAGSPFQRYVNGDRQALSAAARKGFAVFQGKGGCSFCHRPPLFTDNDFHDIGVPQLGPDKTDAGRSPVSRDPADAGKFRTPALYNTASSAFFMHDGAFSTLEEVVDHYNKGGDPSAPNQDRFIVPLNLSAEEKGDLVEFLKSLTDEDLNRIK